MNSDMKPAYRTKLGKYYLGDFENIPKAKIWDNLRGKIQLIITSPPFPLNNKKSYGNLSGEKYKKWFANLAPIFSELLTEDGSVVIELGNAWVSGRPVQSLLHLESLMDFVNYPSAGFRLCQQFIYYNPSRLPSPAEWVTIKRIRTTDSYTHIWWMAKTDYPKADNSKVLRPYSKSMKDLLRRQSYNSGKRPSEHQIGKTSFLTDNRGSIAQNFFELEPMEENRQLRLPNAFSFANTNSNDYFHKICRKHNIIPHPARMPEGLPAFFIQFLTDLNDLVLDPFAGTNTTGYVAECLQRRWVSIEIEEDYLEQAKIRLEDPIIQTFHRSGE